MSTWIVRSDFCVKCRDKKRNEWHPVTSSPSEKWKTSNKRYLPNMRHFDVQKLAKHNRTSNNLFCEYIFLGIVPLHQIIPFHRGTVLVWRFFSISPSILFSTSKKRSSPWHQHRHHQRVPFLSLLAVAFFDSISSESGSCKQNVRRSNHLFF